MNLEQGQQQPASGEPPATDSLELDVASVFGFDEPAAEQATEPAAADTSPASAPTPEGTVGEAPQSPSVTPAAPAATPAAPEPAPAAASGEPSATPSPASATPAAAPTPEEQALARASLEAQVVALQATVDQLRASPQAGAQPQPSAEPGQGEQPVQLPQYALTLPQQVEEALNSEDPQLFRAGVLNIMNSLAAIVHHNVRTEVRGMLAQRDQSRQADSTAEQQRQDMAAAQEQYYGAFPAHKNPTLLPIIQQKAGEIATQYPGLTWGPDYINALGARVNAAIAALGGGAAQPEPQPFVPPGSTPPPRPAAGLPSGTRGEVPTSELQGVDLIEDTFR